LMTGTISRDEREYWDNNQRSIEAWGIPLRRLRPE